jgi:CubicO group peptidase (beta-lactamase class C family)
MRIIFKINLALLLLLLPACLFAQEKRIDQYMQAEFSNGFNGNVLVSKGDEIIYKKSWGYRNLDSLLLLNNNSVFELASISKQFTAMGILLLEQKGKLALSDTLRKFFPELPYNHISIYNLLTHTSGLPDYMSAMKDKWDHHQIAFNGDMIAFLANEKPKPNFAPGQKFEYSNTGFALLASIIEKLSGESYRDYMDRNVFKPLGMHHTRVYNTRRLLKDTIPGYAYGYIFSVPNQKYMMPDSLKEYDFVYYLDGITGDGAVNSTTGDLLKWESALLNNKLLQKDAQQSMLSYHSLMDTTEKTYYGYGLELGKNDFGRYMAHDGGWPGYRTSIIHYIDSGYTIIVLSNNQSYATNISDGIARIIYSKPLDFPYQHKEIALDKNILDHYTGKYLVPQAIELIKRDNKLYRHLPNTPIENDVELKPESSTKFFYANHTDVQLAFDVDANGKVKKAYAIVCGIMREIKKI